MQINGKEYRLVPRDQTDEMEARAIHALQEVRARLGKYLSDESLVGVVYNAMYAAAPTPEATEVARDALDAARYRRIRENWIDCDELGLHGRTAVIDARIDAAIAAGGEDG